MPKMCISAPLIIDTTQMTKIGVIHFLHLTQPNFAGPPHNHTAIKIIPNASAAVPKTTCDQTVTEANRESPPSSLKPFVKVGTMTKNIRAVCKVSAITVEYPCNIKFFLLLGPLKNGRPNINKNKITI